MACPAFLPGASKGDYYQGFCAAAPQEDIPEDKLRLCCNRSYARGSCARAAALDADAAQFLVKSDQAGVVEIAWSLERNHHPVAVGVLAIPPGFVGVTPLEIQAKALAEAYVRDRINDR